MNDVHGTIPVEKVRQALHRSPSGYLSNEETLAAYKDLRKSLSVLLEDSKPGTEEPTGDVWVSLDGKWPLFHRQSDGDWDAGYWTNHDGYEMPWSELLQYFGTKDVVVYRREEVGEARPSEKHQDHVSLERALYVLGGVHEGSITATEKEAVQRCMRALRVLPTYVGCWP